MSIITFYNKDREQTGKTLSAIAVATKMAIERNLKILLISTSFNDRTMKNCFFKESVNNKNIKELGIQNSNVAVESGIAGLAKLVASNKLEPKLITDYANVILKDRLEILLGYIPPTTNSYQENHYEHEKITNCYADLIQLANQHYDMVIVDVDWQLNKEVKQKIFDISNLNIMVISQRLDSLNTYLDRLQRYPYLKELKYMMIVGKFYSDTKYNKKNVMRYLKMKDLNIIPFNTLFFEAAEEHNVTELFLKLRNIKDTQDENYIFINEIQILVDKIIARIKELQKKMR